MPIASGSQIRRSPGMSARRTIKAVAPNDATLVRLRPARCGTVPKTSELTACTITSAPRPPVRSRDPRAAPHSLRFGVSRSWRLPHIGRLPAGCGSMWEPSPDPEAAAALGETAASHRLRRGGGRGAARRGRPGRGGRWTPSCTRSGSRPTSSATRSACCCSPVPILRIVVRGRLRALRLGLATEDGELLSHAHASSRRGVYLTFDTFSDGENDPPGWVASFTPTAYWLASLTPRVQVARALDIGTGNGVHALLAARHADEVVATDVNPRALAFTQISAGLNGWTTSSATRQSSSSLLPARRSD